MRKQELMRTEMRQKSFLGAFGLQFLQ